MAALTLEWSWPAYLAAIYVVGATANHSLFLAIHELSHNLGFKSISHNKLLSMVANLPIGIAYCITFKPYHMEHHRYQVCNAPRRPQIAAKRRCRCVACGGLGGAWAGGALGGHGRDYRCVCVSVCVHVSVCVCKCKQTCEQSGVAVCVQCAMC